MIQANELRIGNLIEYDPKQVDEGTEIIPLPVTSVSYDDKITVDDGYTNLYDCIDFNPIPLTPEILEKCGFKKHSNSNEFWNHWVAPNGWNISESLHSEESAGVKTGLYYWGETYLEVQYLHQLQNLFFCHCKSELTYTP